MLSQSQTNFFINRPISIDHPLIKEAFKENSYEILQFLDKEDIVNLKQVNYFFFDLCECHELFSNSMDSLGKLFTMSVNTSSIVAKPKTSKLREKYNFNKPINEYYKNSAEYNKRIQSGRRKKNKQ